MATSSENSSSSADFLATQRKAWGSKPRLRLAPFLLPVVWLSAIACGIWALEEYKATPGSAGETPAFLVDELRRSPETGRPHLLMFVHPKCPCSDASLAQFAELLERNPEAAAAEVVFVKPTGTGPGWVHTRLWDRANKLPGVRVVCDEDGVLAHKLGAETSGYVVLYDAKGNLRFAGGITRSRGHEGDNPGQRALTALLRGGPAIDTRCAVFGCPLFTPRGRDRSADSHRKPFHGP